MRNEDGSEHCVYAYLSRRAAHVFPSARIPLTSKLFRIVLTGGSHDLASCMGVSVRTLHRLLANDHLTAIALRTWARREAAQELLTRRVAQRTIAALLGFRTIATLQGFLRRELHTTATQARTTARYNALADEITEWPQNDQCGNKGER